MPNFNVFLIGLLVLGFAIIYCISTRDKKAEEKAELASAAKKVGVVLTQPDLSEQTRHLLLEDELCGRDFTVCQQLLQPYGWKVIYGLPYYPIERHCLAVETEPGCQRVSRIAQIQF